MVRNVNTKQATALAKDSVFVTLPTSRSKVFFAFLHLPRRATGNEYIRPQAISDGASGIYQWKEGKFVYKSGRWLGENGAARARPAASCIMYRSRQAARVVDDGIDVTTLRS